MVRPSRAVEPGHQVEHLDLVRDVEERGGFVEQEQPGVLREGHRDPHALALPARQLVDRAIGEIGRAGGRQCSAHRGLVGRRPLLEERLMRGAPSRHQVADEDAVGCDRALWQQAEPSSRRAWCARRWIDFAVEDRPCHCRRTEQPCEGTEQGRLAARIRADDHRHLCPSGTSAATGPSVTTTRPS
jgi:hypothetical protein